MRPASTVRSRASGPSTPWVTVPRAPAWLGAFAVVAVLGLGACGSSATTSTSASSTSASSTAASSTAPETSAEGSPTTEVVAPSKKVFKDPATPIKVAVGEKFAIRVVENPSIGDQWAIVSAPEEHVATVEGDSYKPDETNPEPGSGGQREFKFKARNPGTTTVTLYDCYRCGPQGTVAPDDAEFAERLTYTIVVG